MARDLYPLESIRGAWGAGFSQGGRQAIENFCDFLLLGQSGDEVIVSADFLRFIRENPNEWSAETLSEVVIGMASAHQENSNG